MLEAEDRLCCLRQGGRPLERYVGEFLELSNRVSWHDAALGACFQLGLDETTIRCDLPVSDFPVIELINLVIYLNGSDWKVKKCKSRNHPAPPENCKASPIHPMPGPSTYMANGYGHPHSLVFLRDRKWASNSADLGAKVLDPPITSVRSALKSSFHLPSQPPPTAKSVPVPPPTAKSVPVPPSAAKPVPAPRQRPPVSALPERPQRDRSAREELPQNFFLGGPYTRGLDNHSGRGEGHYGSPVQLVKTNDLVMASRVPRSAMAPRTGTALEASREQEAGSPASRAVPVLGAMADLGTQDCSLEASRAPTSPPLPTGCCMVWGTRLPGGGGRIVRAPSPFLSPPSSVTSSDMHQIPVTIIANHLSSDSPHLSSAINSPHKSQLLPVPSRPVYRSLPRTVTRPNNTYLCFLPSSFFSDPPVSPHRSSPFVPGSRSPPILQRTPINSQLRPIRTVSLSGFLTCQSLHPISILSSINHSVVSLTCCLPRLCCDNSNTNILVTLYNQVSFVNIS